MMKREADHTAGPMALAIHLLVVYVALVATIWIQLGVQSLKNSTDEREAELVQFENQVHKARRAPAREIDGLAEELEALFETQTWYRNVGPVRPTVVTSPAGLTFRLAPTSRSVRKESR